MRSIASVKALAPNRRVRSREGYWAAKRNRSRNKAFCPHRRRLRLWICAAICSLQCRFHPLGEPSHPCWRPTPSAGRVSPSQAVLTKCSQSAAATGSSPNSPLTLGRSHCTINYTRSPKSLHDASISGDGLRRSSECKLMTPYTACACRRAPAELLALPALSRIPFCPSL